MVSANQLHEGFRNSFQFNESLLIFEILLRLPDRWRDRGSMMTVPREVPSRTEMPEGLLAMIIGLRCWMLVLLLDRDRLNSSRSESCDDAEEARRWRCICVGSTCCTLAHRAKSDRTIITIGS